MSSYDKLYESPALFGKPLKELMDFYRSYPKRGTLLDIGCGQGRNSIPLAEMGYAVTGMDQSRLGLEQLRNEAQKHALNILVEYGDMYALSDLSSYNFILLDSMFHFYAKDVKREIKLIEDIYSKCEVETVISICLMRTKVKENVLVKLLEKLGGEEIFKSTAEYIFNDPLTNFSSTSDYLVYCVEKK